MRTPRMPPYTCPEIDTAIEACETAYDAADDADQDSVSAMCGALKAISDALNGQSDRLEAIRESNRLLRAAAEFWEEKFNDAFSELQALRERIDT